jgi:hypothetical protein
VRLTPCADERLATKIETVNSIAITLTTATAISEDRFDPIENLTKLAGKPNILMTFPPNWLGIVVKAGDSSSGVQTENEFARFC